MRPEQDPFEYINKTYRLSVGKGSKVIFKEGSLDEAHGEIAGADGAYLLIKMGSKKPQPYHPTWELKHL